MTETPKQRSRTMRAVRSKGTEAELTVRRALRVLGETGYRLNRSDLPGTPDIAFIGRRKAIFVHGCFWHGHHCKRGSRCPKTNRDYWAAKIARNIKRDRESELALLAKGWSVCVIWECELQNCQGLQEMLTAFVGKR